MFCMPNILTGYKSGLQAGVIRTWTLLFHAVLICAVCGLSVDLITCATFFQSDKNHSDSTFHLYCFHRLLMKKSDYDLPIHALCLLRINQRDMRRVFTFPEIAEKKSLSPLTLYFSFAHPLTVRWRFNPLPPLSCLGHLCLFTFSKRTFIVHSCLTPRTCVVCNEVTDSALCTTAAAD